MQNLQLFVETLTDKIFSKTEARFLFYVAEKFLLKIESATILVSMQRDGSFEMQLLPENIVADDALVIAYKAPVGSVINLTDTKVSITTPAECMLDQTHLTYLLSLFEFDAQISEIESAYQNIYLASAFGVAPFEVFAINEGHSPVYRYDMTESERVVTTCNSTEDSIVYFSFFNTVDPYDDELTSLILQALNHSFVNAEQLDELSFIDAYFDDLGIEGFIVSKPIFLREMEVHGKSIIPFVVNPVPIGTKAKLEQQDLTEIRRALSQWNVKNGYFDFESYFNQQSYQLSW